METGKNVIATTLLAASALLGRAVMPSEPAASIRLVAEADRRSWRWRRMALRALVDLELFKPKGVLAGEALARAFAELTDIYHAQNAPEHDRPPRAHRER